MSKVFSETKKKRIYERDNGKCVICSKDVKFNKTSKFNDYDANLDHIVPKSYGGKNCDSNLRLLCRNCNLRRHNKTGDRLIGLIKSRIESSSLEKYIWNLLNEKRIGLITEENIQDIKHLLLEIHKKNINLLKNL